MVIISDIRESERILVESKVTEQAKRVRQAFVAASPHAQIALPTDEAWRKQRRLAGPSMSKRYLERMSGRISTGADNLVKLWQAKTQIIGSCAFDAGPDIQLSTMDTMGDITTGSLFGCIKSAHAALPTGATQLSPIVYFPNPNPPPLYEAVSVIMESIEAAIKAPFPSLHARLIKYTSFSWRKQFGVLSSFLNQAITESRGREKSAENKDVGLATDSDCVLDMIIQREAREGAEAFGEGAIRDELMSFIFAGRDTTSSMLRWLLKYLPTDIGIQRRLHEEVCNVFGQGDLHEPLDFNLLDNSERLPLLEAVVMETMRCAGVGPQISRELVQDEVILGRSVPKGTEVVFATALMSRDKTRWGDDADEWRPTRWLTQDGAFDRSAGPSFPFGLGQRSCFGQRLATYEIKAYTAALSRGFFFKSVPHEVDSWEAQLEGLAKQPRLCYVSLERW
ncbi:unnamed protein product [Rhizoctonia solani]|uniref:Uncharacterized protein n=1 Tax=Rhizoctonia solani TaxID=456999 RepID=A0A8H3AYI4_9AGAM|nr:unnamed protein product [Rhizoctonia solani]